MSKPSEPPHPSDSKAQPVSTPPPSARINPLPSHWKPRGPVAQSDPTTSAPSAPINPRISLGPLPRPPRVTLDLWRKRRAPILPCVLALSASLLTSGVGCRSLLERKTETVLHVEPPTPQPELTAAQRDDAYRSSYDQGLNLVREGNYGLAMAAFEEALRYAPLSHDALFNLGACHEALGDPFQALGIYRRVLEVDPNDADCYANMGTCCIKLAHREQNPAWITLARDAWRRSLELRPNQPDVAKYLADVNHDGEP